MRFRFCMSAAILAAAMALPGAVQAQDGGLFGILGLTPQEKEAIDYRERAPLVVPPSRDLPQPVEYSAIDEANWPKDPDVRRKLRAAYLKKNPPRELSDSEKSLEFIRYAQNAKKRKKNVGGVQPDYVDPYLTTGEPRRKYLTDPPEGSRAPAAEPPSTALQQ
jgi:hypothetical protein